MSATRRSLMTALGAGAILAPRLARPQGTFPSRPVRVIVGTAAGSAPDTAMRLLAPRFEAAWGQPVVVDNRPGAGGNLGAATVVRAEPDGHTLLFAHATTIVLNQHLMRAMPFDPARDLTPITLLMTTPFLVAARPGLGIRNLAELASLAGRRELTFGTSGATTLPRLTGEALARAAGVNLLNVPYGGSPAALTDTLAGRTDLIIDGTPLLTPQIRAGNLVPIAITSATRFPGLEEVPAIAETYPGLALGGWFGMMGPAGLAIATVARIAADAERILGEGPLRARLLSDYGAVAEVGGPDAFARFTATERETLGRLVATVGLRAE